MNRFCILFALFLADFSGKASPAKPEPPAALPVPKIVSIRLEPASIALLNGRDERRVLVIGETGTGQKIDLTAEAKMISEAPIVEIDGRNFIRPKSKGETRISVSAAGLVMPLPVKVEDAVLPPVG
ncbi:MAG: hypothetical protein ABIV39_19565, partial [Verrucomicrobiota bacterium]